jgi:hypothetical protein
VTLPNADRAIVEPEKVRDYLLATDHTSGRGKARFFGSLGFTRADWSRLQTALLLLARNGAAELAPANRFGQKYVVRGPIQGPNGRTAQIVSAWVILYGQDVPRLLSAYPGSRP